MLRPRVLRRSPAKVPPLPGAPKSPGAPKLDSSPEAPAKGAPQIEQQPELQPAPGSAKSPFGYGAGRKSLFGEILDWMLAPLLLVWPLSVVITSLVAQSLASKPFDQALEDNARALATQVRAVRGPDTPQIAFYFPASARSVLQTDEVDRKFYQVLGLRGELISGEANLALPPEGEPRSIDQVQFRDDSFEGDALRVAYLWVQPVLPNGTLASGTPVLVQVAESLGKRDALANDIIKGVIFPQFTILPISVLLVYLGLGRGIRPLNALQQQIRQRRPEDLSPLPVDETPDELRPLVMAINDLLAKQQTSLATQKRFIADAAHQMKTPLAGMRMQAELAQRQSDPAELRASLLQLARSTEQATRVVNQLLALASTEHRGQQSAARTRVDLSRLAAAVLHDLAPLAFDKRIDLGFESSGPAIMLGDALLLTELIKNLLDNALRYTPEGGTVTVSIAHDASGQRVLLSVEDSGSGIAPDDRELVFEPFYRALGSGADGSGLGLAIVKEIANQHQADIRVEYNPKLIGAKLPGTQVSVSFAAA